MSSLAFIIFCSICGESNTWTCTCLRTSVSAHCERPKAGGAKTRDNGEDRTAISWFSIQLATNVARFCPILPDIVRYCLILSGIARFRPPAFDRSHYAWPVRDCRRWLWLLLRSELRAGRPRLQFVCLVKCQLNAVQLPARRADVSALFIGSCFETNCITRLNCVPWKPSSWQPKTHAYFLIPGR